MKEVNTQFYTTFVITFYYGSRTVISYGSGSTTLDLKELSHKIDIKF
jgi:hypothetical protein